MDVMGKETRLVFFFRHFLSCSLVALFVLWRYASGQQPQLAELPWAGREGYGWMDGLVNGWAGTLVR